MTPYFITFTVAALASLAHFIKELRKYTIIFVFIVSGYLMLFAGLRHVGVGRDDFNYYDMFVNQAPTLWQWIGGRFTYHFSELYMEPGYVFVNAFLKTFTGNYTVLFIFTAIMSVGIATYNYVKYSNYVLISMLLYYVHTYLYRDMNQVRAGLAAAIGLFLIAEVHKREHLKICRTLVLAGVFHIASLCLLLPYVLSFASITRKKMFLMYAASIGFAIAGTATTILAMLPDSGFMFVKINGYASDRSFGAALGILDATNVKNSLILLLVLVYWNRLRTKIPYFETLALFLTLGTAWRIAFSDIGIMAGRIATFFDIVEVIVIPYFLCLFERKWIGFCIIIAYAFVTLYLNLFVARINAEPYRLATL